MRALHHERTLWSGQLLYYEHEHGSELLWAGLLRHEDLSSRIQLRGDPGRPGPPVRPPAVHVQEPTSRARRGCVATCTSVRAWTDAGLLPRGRGRWTGQHCSSGSSSKQPSIFFFVGPVFFPWALKWKPLASAATTPRRKSGSFAKTTSACVFRASAAGRMVRGSPPARTAFFQLRPPTCSTNRIGRFGSTADLGTGRPGRRALTERGVPGNRSLTFSSLRTGNGRSPSCRTTVGRG